MLKRRIVTLITVLFILCGGLWAWGSLPQAKAFKGGGDTATVELDGQTAGGLEKNGTAYIPVDEVGKALGRNVSKKDGKYLIQSRLDRILKKGVIRVGTTGDYRPFTYYDPESKTYEGYDIDAAKRLGKDLGVKVEFVKTSWPTLMEDLRHNKFDIAMGGISRSLDREKKAHFSKPYIDFGKSPLIRKEDKDKYKSLSDIDQPDVTIGVNPGGTNEKFVKEHIKQAKVKVVQDNLDIPKMVAEGKVDVMITDSVEARYYASRDPRLYAALTDHTFTKSQKGYLMHRGDPDFQNWIDLWVAEMKLQGEFDKLEAKWLE
ncbi:cyclohexadienyl dehydratase [Scopulibacillus darangshiensis]|uniref:Cyclohexadienyl dehydratase n=1 Tax=Scopulibacillus darangshiensis TaxID=442528 RepID=A0A4R2NSN5_9BACL|nr:transporter substrate-binding domain-containing protein [Scopulibacillus darangshiensis]TCP24963.1 cyclohexadienyl dehydratase [Scopulibacillus darangshiensis]